MSRRILVLDTMIEIGEKRVKTHARQTTVVPDGVPVSVLDTGKDNTLLVKLGSGPVVEVGQSREDILTQLGFSAAEIGALDAYEMNPPPGTPVKDEGADVPPSPMVPPNPPAPTAKDI